jgi:signal transduction histidine kinase
MGIGLLLVYFAYGLAFWAMGLAVLLESGRAPSKGDARSLHWLAAFGILHGTHEWLEAFLLVLRSLGTPLPSWLDWLRLALLSISFSCLYAYALQALTNNASTRGTKYWRSSVVAFVGVALLIALGISQQRGLINWPTLLDAAARYALAVPSAILAAVAVRAASNSEHARDHPAITRNLRLAALGFGGYAAAQLFVHAQPWFPASVINQEALLALLGLPIQAVRGVLAALIAFGLLRAMQAAEQERQQQFVAAHQARLAALEQQDALRRDLLRHVVRSQEDERARIARELHDDVAQLLSAFSLHLGSLRSKLKRPDTTEVLDRLQGLSNQMSQSLYRLVRDLRPSHLDNLGLVPAIKFLLSQEYGPKGLHVTFRLAGNPKPLRDLIDTALFRIAQEALTNVIRHAGVAEAEVAVQYYEDRVTLRISDCGRGFDPAEQFNPPRGWGLAGMRERVEGLGGRLSLQTAVSQGTTIEVVVPIGTQAQQGTGDE